MSLHINIGGFLTRRALLSPDREGIVCDDVRLSYRELNKRSNRLAHMMLGLGIKKGDRVALLAQNIPEYYDLFFGLGKIGAILVPINYRLAGPEMEYILNDCEARVLVFQEEYTETIESIRKDISPHKLVCIGWNTPGWAMSYDKLMAESSAEEPMLASSDDDTLTIIYTSGTTGRPKGAELTHTNYFWTSTGMAATLDDTGDRFLVPLPLFHIATLAYLPMFAHFGKTAVMQKTFDPERFLRVLPREKITSFGAVPQLLNFVKEHEDFSSDKFSTVRMILVSAAPVPVQLIREYAEAGIEIRQRYGLTESTGPVTVISSDRAISKAGSCGLPLFHTSVKVVKDDGSEAGCEETGEVLLKSKNVMKRYWNKPEDTDQALRDGWLHTGDLARLDEEGFLYIVDRKKDMIISGGENIYPAEIEKYILENSKIADVGVIGYPHPRWGEAVKAVVVLKPGHSMTEEELKEWCAGKIGKYKIPKAVVFADSIPRTASGKILKRELRETYN